MMPPMTTFLNEPFSTVLQSALFKNWSYEIITDGDQDEKRVYYRFGHHGLEFEVDLNDTVICIFLHATDFGGFDEALIDIPFSSTRAHVLEHFGKPSMSGEQTTNPYLGKRGPWDRFDNSELGIHIRYCADSDGIKMITLMQSSSIPR